MSSNSLEPQASLESNPAAPDIAQYQAEIDRITLAWNADIDHRNHIEAQLRTSQGLLQIVMDTLPASIFWKDKNLHYLGCNQNFARDWGLDRPHEVAGKTDYDAPWTKEEAYFFRTCDRRVMDNREPEFGIIEPQLRSDGTQAWLETNKAPLFNANGEVIGVLGTYQDITDLKQSEIQLQALNQELEHKTQELTELYQNLEQKVIERTTELHQANEQLKVEIAEREASEAQLKCALNELQAAQAQLVQQEKMSSLGQMVAGVAHEINNPVNFIHGNLVPVRQFTDQLLSLVGLYQAHYPDSPPEIQQQLHSIDLPFVSRDIYKIIDSMETGSLRIQKIIDSLRCFSHLDEADLKITDIHQGIDSVLVLLHNRLRDAHPHQQIQITQQYATVPPIECYASQLNQVFMSLMSNAIDALVDCASESHSPTITITTEVTDHEQLQVDIHDNGIGIAENLQHRIFDPFFSTKPVGQGTGLGLSVSYNIITEMHQGKMWCRSTPGEGSTFTIEIPLLQTLARLPQFTLATQEAALAPE